MLREDGREVAVKEVLKTGSQWKDSMQEELDILAKLMPHENVVSYKVKPVNIDLVHDVKLTLLTCFLMFDWSASLITIAQSSHLIITYIMHKPRGNATVSLISLIILLYSLIHWILA